MQHVRNVCQESVVFLCSSNGVWQQGVVVSINAATIAMDVRRNVSAAKQSLR